MEWSKYVLSLIVGLGLVILFGGKGERRNKWLLAAGFGLGLLAMELTVAYMLTRPLWMYAVSIMKGLLLFSLIVLAGYGKEWLMSRRKDAQESEPVHPIRQWIEEYQESFAQLSRSFCMTPRLAEGLDRGERILQNRLAENRAAAAGQLGEMSQILGQAMDRIYGTREDDQLEQEIGKRLRLLGVRVQKVFLYQPVGRKQQVYISMRTKRKICVPVRKIASILSDVLECEMMPARDSRSFVSQERVTVLFVEEVAYNVLYGVKKATRSGEAVSGDNFSVFWLPDGQFAAALSDGMGSGVEACNQSETVLDLLEQFLEAGFSRETALRMINSSIVFQPDTRIFSTMDLASIDLYTGVCEFLKIGGAASFLRRENKVECIHGNGMPMGADGNLNLEPYRLRMYDGNLIFLITDGVISALPRGEEIELLKEMIAALPVGNPSEMAEKLLAQVQAFGNSNDDMTVLAAGIWKR